MVLHVVPVVLVRCNKPPPKTVQIRLWHMAHGYSTLHVIINWASNFASYPSRVVLRVHMLHPYVRTSWYITSIAHVFRPQRDGSSRFRPKAFHQLKWWMTQSICMPSTNKSKDVAVLTKHVVLVSTTVTLTPRMTSVQLGAVVGTFGGTNALGSESGSFFSLN
jgi:hypothetical protein